MQELDKLKENYSASLEEMTKERNIALIIIKELKTQIAELKVKLYDIEHQDDQD